MRSELNRRIQWWVGEEAQLTWMIVVAATAIALQDGSRPVDEESRHEATRHQWNRSISLRDIRDICDDGAEADGGGEQHGGEEAHCRDEAEASWVG